MFMYAPGIGWSSDLLEADDKEQDTNAVVGM